MSRARTIALIVLFSTLAAIATRPGMVGAAEFRNGTSPSISAAETINDDLYVTGDEIVIAGRVTGDVVAAARTVRVTGQVGGSLQVLSGEVDVEGSVVGSVRVATGDLAVTGDVGGDVLVATGQIRLDSSGSIDGDLLVAGGDARLDGSVGGDVRGDVGELTLNGPVDGAVDVTADQVRLLSRARVAEGLRYRSGNEATIANGATVVGDTVRREPSRGLGGDDLLSWIGSPWFRLLCGLIAGLILVLLLPRGSAAVADAARLAPFTSFLLGLILFWFLPPLLGLLLITLVGAPVALIGFAIYAGLVYLSQVFVGLAIGRLILPKRWDIASRGYNLLAMTIGVLLLAAVRMIRLPFVGFTVAALTAVFALGAVVVAIRAARRAVFRTAY